MFHKGTTVRGQRGERQFQERGAKKRKVDPVKEASKKKAASRKKAILQDRDLKQSDRP